MEIILANPPLIDEIHAAFGVKGKQVLFAWGDKIYNPLCVKVPPQLVHHELVHAEQQRKFSSVEDWWRKYISDSAFRLEQEIPAHIAEYISLVRINGNNRKNRRVLMMRTAQRLAGSIYKWDPFLSVVQAKSLLKGHIQWGTSHENSHYEK